MRENQVASLTHSRDLARFLGVCPDGNQTCHLPVRRPALTGPGRTVSIVIFPRFSIPAMTVTASTGSALTVCQALCY